MKFKTTALLVIAGAFLLGGCNSAANNPNPPTNNVYVTPTTQPTSTPTKTQSLNEMNSQLNATVDDGGASELNQLQKDASGL